MRIPHRGTEGRLTTNMTPMIDVVFLLIIFFLVSSHLARQETQVPLELPDAATFREETDQQHRLTINVLADGSWMVAGTEMTEARLRIRLRAHQARHGEAAPVRIRTDETVPYQRVEPLLRISASEGLWNAAFAVREGGR
jgi:biopolymer transport protein ExbD